MDKNDGWFSSQPRGAEGDQFFQVRIPVYLYNYRVLFMNSACTIYIVFIILNKLSGAGKFLQSHIRVVTKEFVER